ncbi:hypothetical protein PMF13cell1_00781 [Blautia producta]|uniref:XRE family transcriptional regulator n=1 Tax=Blautia producta TaxID=33035 RepID=A0A4P6LTG5_9FIRM|nr:hypothetical protein [Blautia producta]QBE95266.1 hypothetical protein PMF13cell1_00781 [Blautia producta]
MGLYENIKKMAEINNLSIGELERDLGILPNTIKTFDEIPPYKKDLAEIATYLGIPVFDLVLGKDTTRLKNVTIEDNHELTLKDKKDISKELDKTMNDIQGKSYSDDLEKIDGESLILLSRAIETTLVNIKKYNKVIYSPKKQKITKR